MERRKFLESVGASTVFILAGARKGASAVPAPTEAAGWRTFEVTTRVEITQPTAGTRAWVPLPLMADTDYQKRLGDTWNGNAAGPRVWRDER